MRSILAVSMVVVTATAHASFDLMLLGDNTTAGSQRVVRYDPINRVVLGSFGTGFINADILEIAVDGATGRAFVQQANSVVKVFNYNTGDFISAFTTLGGDVQFDAASNSVSFSNGSGGGTSPSRTYDATTGALISTTSGYFVSTSPKRRPGTSWFASWSIVNGSSDVGALRFSLAGGAPIDPPVVGPAWGNFTAPRRSIFTTDNRFLGIASDSTANSLSIWSISTNTSGYVGGISTGTTFSTANTNANIVNGHGQLAYILSGSSLISYHTGLNSTLGTQTLGFATGANISGMAIVLAPEPGTLVALGVGAAALLRRRRRTGR